LSDIADFVDFRQLAIHYATTLLDPNCTLEKEHSILDSMSRMRSTDPDLFEAFRATILEESQQCIEDRIKGNPRLPFWWRPAIVNNTYLPFSQVET
jgi:hypothetical protein